MYGYIDPISPHRIKISIKQRYNTHLGGEKNKAILVNPECCFSLYA